MSEENELVDEALRSLGVSQDQEDNPAPADEPAPDEGTTGEAEPEQVPPDKLRGKSAEEITSIYVELENKFRERDGELGELRRQVDELRQTQTRDPEQAPQAPPRIDPDELDEAIEENPRGALSALVEMGYGPNTAVYRHAMKGWAEADPFEASEFHTAFLLDQQQKQFQQTYAQSLEPLQQQQQTQVVTQAYYNVGQKHTDLGSLAGEIQKIAEASPAIVAELGSGDPSRIEQTIENLYFIAKGQALASGATQETTAAPSDGAKLAASVQTAQTAPAGSRAEPEPDELVLMARKALGDMTLPD